MLFCERAHAETTQYEFLLDLFSNPEFYNQVGTIFFEIGGKHLNPLVHKFLHSTGLPEEEVEKQAIDIQRLAHWRPFWNSYTFTILLKGLYQINQNLDAEHKFNLIFCDYPFDWTKVKTKKDVYDVNANPAERDKIMAETIIENFDSISKTAKRKKAIALLNSIHGYTNKSYIRNTNIKPQQFTSAGAHLKDHYQDRVANILINSVNSLERLIDNGRWDAAFALNGNKPIGFSFKNSPFGEIDCEIHNEFCNLTYQDVFTGMVFYKPLEEHTLIYGYKNYISDNFMKEMQRRNKIWIYKHPTKPETIRNWYNKQQVTQYNGIETMKIIIKQLVDSVD